MNSLSQKNYEGLNKKMILKKLFFRWNIKSKLLLSQYKYLMISYISFFVFIFSVEIYFLMYNLISA